MRTVVGYHRYDTATELLLLNEIWQLQSKLTNYFYPQQKLISKVRTGAKVSKKHDKAATPFHRAIDHPTMTVERIVALTRTYSLINPAATQRQIQALTTQLLTLTTSKAAPTTKAPFPSAHGHMRQRIHLRAHLDMRQQGPGRDPACGQKHPLWITRRHQPELSATTPRRPSAPKSGSSIAEKSGPAAQQLPAVDVDDLPGDPLRGVAEQEHRSSSRCRSTSPSRGSGVQAA